MGKEVISVSLDEDLLSVIDEKCDNRSEWFNQKIRQLVTDAEYLRDQKRELESERDQLRERKQSIEQEIWELDDQIEELGDRISEAETLQRVRDEIGMKRIQRVRKTVNSHKYDSDPRSMTADQVIENNCRKIAEAEDLEVDLVERVLRLHISS